MYFSGNFRSPKRYLIDKKGVFPTGLLYLVDEYLEKNKIKYSRNDLRRVPMALESKFSLSLGVTPYDDQVNAAKASLAGRGIIVAPTGAGKSVIAALIIHRLQVRTLVVVPNIELKKQLNHSLKIIFGKDRVGDLKDQKDVAIENIDSNQLKKGCKSYDCVIIDEFHHSGAKTYRDLNKNYWNHIYYKLGLTATPFRSNEDERLLLESVLSNTIYEIRYQEAVSKGYIVPIEAYYLDIPKTKITGNSMSWASVYSELVVHNEYRNKLIANIINNLESDKKSSLCLVKEIAHGENIKKLTSLAFAKGENDNNRELILEFNLKERTGLIGTNGVLGEGIDTKPCEYVIIAGLGKSKNAFAQQCGRGVRRFEDKESCKILIFRDSSHKFTLNHFKSQCKYLLDLYGVSPTKLTL